MYQICEIPVCCLCIFDPVTHATRVSIQCQMHRTTGDISFQRNDQNAGRDWVRSLCHSLGFYSEQHFLITCFKHVRRSNIYSGHLRPHEHTRMKGLTDVTCHLISFYEWPDSTDMNRSHRSCDVIEIGHNLMKRHSQ